MTISSENPQTISACTIDKSCCEGEETGPSCTLVPTEMPERLKRLQVLFAQAKKHTVGTGFAKYWFNNTEHLRDELTELVKLEQVCCAHISWKLSQLGDQQILTLTGEEAAIPKLISLLIPVQPEGVVQ